MLKHLSFLNLDRVSFETRCHQSQEGAGQLVREVLFTFAFIIAASKEDNETW